MSRLYDAAEPGVISEDMLRQLVIEQGPTGEAGRIVQVEGLQFTEITELRVDFKNIKQIENLWQFTALRKLQLDNNIISVITGLDELVNLEWLDLSFNNIQEIQGLDRLTKLRDLSLAHNLIDRVDRLETLENLQVLSLGSNELDNLQETVMYIRKHLLSLQSLCLRGNKFSPIERHREETDIAKLYRTYQLYTVAYLPQLIYLDFEMITEEARETALEEHHEDVSDLEREERELANKLKEEQQLHAKRQQQKMAYVDGLEGDELYVALFNEDTECERLKLLPGEEERLLEYCQKFTAICQDILALGLQAEDKRTIERKAFLAGYDEALKQNQDKSVERVKVYETCKAELLNDQGEGSHVLTEKITDLQYDLIKYEMQLVDQLEEIIKEFERNYNDMITQFLESVQNNTTRLRELEKEHHETVTETATQLYEAHSKGQLEEDIPDGLRVLFVDKDTLMGAINASHDTHMLAIDNKEDSMRLRLQKDTKVLLDDIMDKETARNRQRVTEILQYIELQREDLEDWLN